MGIDIAFLWGIDGGKGTESVFNGWGRLKNLEQSFSLMDGCRLSVDNGTTSLALSLQMHHMKSILYNQ